MSDPPALACYSSKLSFPVGQKNWSQSVFRLDLVSGNAALRLNEGERAIDTFSERFHRDRLIGSSPDATTVRLWPRSDVRNAVMSTQLLSSSSSFFRRSIPRLRSLNVDVDVAQQQHERRQKCCLTATQLQRIFITTTTRHLTTNCGLTSYKQYANKYKVINQWKNKWRTIGLLT